MSHEVVIRLHDQERLRRDLELAWASAPNPRRAVEFILGRFVGDLREYPYQWPVQNEPPTEHEWRFGRLISNPWKFPTRFFQTLEKCVDCIRLADRFHPLVSAACGGRTGIVELLVRKGADVDYAIARLQEIQDEESIAMILSISQVRSQTPGAVIGPGSMCMTTFPPEGRNHLIR